MDGFFEFVYLINKKCYYAIPRPLGKKLLDDIKTSIKKVQLNFVTCENSEFHDAIMRHVIMKYKQDIIQKGTPVMRSDVSPIGKLSCFIFLLSIYEYIKEAAAEVLSLNGDIQGKPSLGILMKAVNRFLFYDEKEKKYDNSMLNDLMRYCEYNFTYQKNRNMLNWDTTNMLYQMRQNSFYTHSKMRYDIRSNIRKQLPLSVTTIDVSTPVSYKLHREQLNISNDIISHDIVKSMSNLKRHIDVLFPLTHHHQEEVNSENMNLYSSITTKEQCLLDHMNRVSKRIHQTHNDTL